MHPRFVASVIVLATAACAGRLHMPGAVRAVEESTRSFESLGHSIRVDAYVPEGRGQRHPAAIVLHGSGGIHMVGGGTEDRYAEALASRGIAAYVVHYFDATGTFIAGLDAEAREYWKWVQVVHDAVDWVRARPEVRPSHIGLFGHSMGAYLAVGAAATNPHVSRVVLLAGGLEPVAVDSIKHMPPTLLLHGTADDQVTIAEEDTLLQLLKRRRTTVVTHRYLGEGHDFGDVAAVDAVERSARFLSEGRVGTLLEVLRRSDTRLTASDTIHGRVP
jgi:carboxymethylenebutenolidase